MRKAISLSSLAVGLALGTGVKAQTFTQLNGLPFVNAIGAFQSNLGSPNTAIDNVAIIRPTPNGLANLAFAVPLSEFASASQVSQLESNTNRVLFQLQRNYTRAIEGSALAAAMNIMPPNAGKRFYVGIGGAGYDGRAAASVNLSVRITDDAIGYVGYARGATQNMLKGGVGYSFD